MAGSAAMTTLHIGHVTARVLVVVVAASAALWLYLESGRPSLPIFAAVGLAVAALVELLAGRHLLDLGVIGDEFVVVRRRAWQRRAHGQERRLDRNRIRGVVIVRSTRPGSQGGPDTRYSVGLRMAAGEHHLLVPQPFRRAEAAEAVAEEIGRLLGLEPEWRDESD